MRYAQFFITDRRGQVEKLGSDGVLPLDGRWSTATALHHAVELGMKRPGITGVQVRQGTYSKYTNLTPVVGLVHLEEIEVNPIVSTDGKMQLVHKDNNAPCFFGEIVEDFRGDKAKIHSASPPHREGTAGYVYVNPQQDDGSFTNRSDQFYVTVFDLKWVAREETQSNA